tara:strand:- start:548 stop:1276 length:729 start_codon:yes stop_codon:yes gene_type:complete
VRLRRITQHVKEQNWFAVALDFLIVVVGILIAFQITNWSEARGDKADARIALEQLEQDFEQILDRTDRSIAAHARYLTAAGRIIRGIRSGDFVEETLFLDMGEATSFSPPPGLSATFTELVSAGRLDLIESQSMRRSLVAYDEYASLNRDQISIFERPITESKPVIFRAMTLEATGVAKTDFDDLEALLDVDRGMLRNDPEILTALQVVYATQDNVHVVLISIRGTILDILDQIKAEQAALR